MRIAPVFPGHLPAAMGREHAEFRIRRQLREEAGHVGRRADEAGRRHHGVGRIIAGNDKAPAHGQPARMAACERDIFGDRHVRHGLAQTGGIDDLALDPDRVGLLGDRFDHKAKETEAVVGVFETRIGLDRGRQPQFCQQFPLGEVGPAINELAGIRAIAGEAGTVRKHLRDGGFRDLRMQAFDILPDRIVEPQLALLAQLHDFGGGETLRMRSDPEAVARGEFFAGDEIGVAERVFGNDLAAMRDGDNTARLLRSP